jgi:hypothetical protein
MSIPSSLSSRPIISSVNSATSRLAKYLDFQLKPFLQFVPSHISSSNEFLLFLKQKYNFSVKFLVTLDVVSLYTEISDDLGITAVEYFISNYQHLVPEFTISLQNLIKLLQLVLRKNCFIFNHKFFLQHKGCPMGSIISPTYAILTMGYIEKLAYTECTKQFGLTFSNFIFDNYVRYIDDIFILWPFDESLLLSFSSLLQKIDPHIKFSLKYNSKQINFLDVSVHIYNSTLITDIYFKETNSFNYTHFYSQVPSHVKRNIPYILAKRIKEIVSDSERQLYRLNELKNKLLDLKYPLKLISDAIAKTYVTTNAKQIRNRTITFKTAHNKNLVPFNSHIKSFHNMFFHNSLVHFSDLKLCFTKNSSLISELNGHNYFVKRCNDQRCKCCESIICSKFIYVNNFKIFPNKIISCVSSNLIYILFCNNCFQFYVGETKNMLRLRVTLHRQHFNTHYGDNNPLAQHINNCQTQFNRHPKFKIYPFYCNPDMSTHSRKQIENYFIHKLNPSLNSKF